MKKNKSFDEKIYAVLVAVHVDGGFTQASPCSKDKIVVKEATKEIKQFCIDEINHILDEVELENSCHILVQPSAKIMEEIQVCSDLNAQEFNKAIDYGYNNAVQDLNKKIKELKKKYETN